MAEMRRVFNVRATLAILIVVGLFVLGGIAIWLGQMTFKDFFATVAPMAGVALGWLFRDMQAAQPQS
jgi:hypothetical protein